MPKYEVERTTFRTYKIEVEANSEREASNKAGACSMSEWQFLGEDEEETSAYLIHEDDDE